MSNKFEIVNAQLKDIPEIMPIYAKAVSYMKSYGNTDQWSDNYPSREIIENDIKNGNFYKLLYEGKIEGVFTLIFGEDPTYRVIEGGKWNTNEPYGTIHRLASAGCVSGVARACFDFALDKINYIRIDTHEKNTAMQKAINDYGFKKCGTIYVTDGSARIAYDYVAFWLEKQGGTCIR